MLINPWLFQDRIHATLIYHDDIYKCRVWEYTTLFNWLKHETRHLNVT